MQTPYHTTAVFPDEAHAQSAYQQVSEFIRTQPCDLSVYRFQLQSRWHISVLGTRPSSPLHVQLEALLAAAAGKAATLPEGLMDQLVLRRLTHVQNGPPWQQQHHPGGLRFPFRNRKRE
ncbi:MAG: hypothetical protein J2P37_22525 [Ktedonobacteraceae bacterium]|nr:hypothetical protein [Ktedonobacteraceae bacterium]